MASLDDGEREALLARVLELFEEVQERRRLVLPYVTSAYRAERR